MPRAHVVVPRALLREAAESVGCESLRDRLRAGAQSDTIPGGFRAALAAMDSGKPIPSPAIVTPDRLSAWRSEVGLTVEQSAALAGVGVRAWERYASGARKVPQWLPDVLAFRFGSGP